LRAARTLTPTRIAPAPLPPPCNKSNNTRTPTHTPTHTHTNTHQHTQSALAKERRELQQQQQRTLLEAIPKDLSRPWEDPMPEEGERHLAAVSRAGLAGLLVCWFVDWLGGRVVGDDDTWPARCRTFTDSCSRTPTPARLRVSHGVVTTPPARMQQEKTLAVTPPPPPPPPPPPRAGAAGPRHDRHQRGARVEGGRAGQGARSQRSCTLQRHAPRQASALLCRQRRALWQASCCFTARTHMRAPSFPRGTPRCVPRVRYRRPRLASRTAAASWSSARACPSTS
jgi:hypothetical protein